MTKYRNNLPQLKGGKFLTDSGLETTLVFHDKIALPHFAACELLRTQQGQDRIFEYYELHTKIALKHKTGFILETPTWRSNPDWAEKLGYDHIELNQLNRDAVSMMMVIREQFETNTSPIVISGCIGPRDDGYDPENFMNEEEAKDYHRAQIKSFEIAGADMVTAITMTYVEEATGVVLAAKASGIPVAISFTVETDGNLPSHQTLKEAIQEVDRKTGDYASYFMINCAHPDHFASVVEQEGEWRNRILGLRANASRKSHAELDAAEVLDDGNPDELGADYRQLADVLPNLRIMGGCCGTDHRHVEAIATRCM